MGCGKKKYERIRSVDVGREGYHFLRVGIIGKKGKRGGTTEKIGKLKKYKK